MNKSEEMNMLEQEIHLKFDALNYETISEKQCVRIIEELTRLKDLLNELF